jgi:hypothetical protein
MERTMAIIAAAPARNLSTVTAMVKVVGVEMSEELC